MSLSRLALIALPVCSFLAATPAFADDAGGSTTTYDSGEEEEEDEDDKGCSTAVAPVSAISLALGVGLVLLNRRRDTET